MLDFERNVERSKEGISEKTKQKLDTDSIVLNMTP